MKKVVVIGCGFAGLSAAKYLVRNSGKIEVTVIEKRSGSDFLPLLPDVLGRCLEPKILSYPVAVLSRKYGFNYIHDEVISLDFPDKTIQTRSSRIAYDYLIIAAGSETNFYGNDNFRKYAHILDEVADARRLYQALTDPGLETFLVSGGGYTGIEVATNIHRYLRRGRKKAEILIVERAPDILGQLPDWMRNYVARHLRKLGIRVIANSLVQRADNVSITLSSGQVFDKALLIWSAGVKTPAFIQDLKIEKNPQGRIKVDQYLRINEYCFAAGDAAYVAWKSTFLRMAVQFAINQGRLAAGNVVRSIYGKPLKAYRPLDLGYLVPMANDRACGYVLNMKLKGIIPLCLHYLMCIYRSIGMRNRLGVAGRLVLFSRRAKENCGEARPAITG